MNLAPLSCKKAPKLLRLSAKKLQRLAEKDALGKLKIFKFYEFLSSLDCTFILHLP